MIETPRLALRPWRNRDRAPFARMCADPSVMEHLGPVMDRADSDAAVDRQIAIHEAHGTCFWAVERRADAKFLGFCGIKPGPEHTPVMGLPEIGWRLARHAWGQGYAREAAQVCLAWAWADRGWPLVYAITTPANARSWGLMERLRMERRTEMDFDHPYVPADSPLRAHWTYTAVRPDAAA